MKKLLAGAAKFGLENLASLGIERVPQNLEERLANKALSKTDENVREYLRNHLSEYEYEKVDGFLAVEGIYAHAHTSANWSIMATQTENIIEDFYNTYPSLEYDRETLTPLLKRAIFDTYHSIISQLSADSRTLYNQSLRYREDSREEHIQIMAGIDALTQYLQSQPEKMFNYSETVKIYEILTEEILSGKLEMSESLIQLTENLVDKQDRSYWTALKIYLHSFKGSEQDVQNLCVQYLRENPKEDLTESVVTFLLQLEKKTALKILQTSITNSKLALLVSDYVADEPSSAIKNIVDEDGNLKNEFENIEYALWVLANHSKKTGNNTAALAAYSKIALIRPTAWVDWSINEMKSLFIFTDIMTNTIFDLLVVRNQIDILWRFSDMFENLCDELRVEYIDILLNCAKVLPIEEFDFHYNQLKLREGEIPRAQRHWYFAHLSDWNSIDEKALRTFCEDTNDDNLWATYLLHRVPDSPEFVLSCIEENSDILKKAFAAVMAYYEALSNTVGEDIAFDTVTSLDIPKELVFSCNVYFAELAIRFSSGNAETYLQVAIDEIFNSSRYITIPSLRELIALLVSLNRWLDASRILERYQDRNPSFMMLRLKVLSSHEDQLEVCANLIDKLEETYSNDDYFLYCKGIIAERELPGSGMDLFKDAFNHNPCPRYARATLTSRLVRNVYLEDDVLSYAANHNDVELMYMCGLTYIRQGKKQKAYTVLLQALINCGDQYHEGLYSVFVGQQLRAHDHEAPPKTIEPGTCCVLTSDDAEQSLKIWIHDESIVLPTPNSDFAGYEHISPNTRTAFLILDRKEGDIVNLPCGDYKVTSINYGDIIATQHCMQILLSHGAVKQIIIDPNNMEAFFEEIRRLGEERSNHINEMMDKYREPNPGLTLELFAQAIGKSYYKTVYALAHDNHIPFWAGSDSVEIDRACILTPSTIAVLSSLDIHPPEKRDGRVKFYVTNALKVELGLNSRDHRNDQTKAVLGFGEDGRPYMIENTPEDKRNLNLYFACLNEWADWAETLDPVSLQEYPTDVKSVADAIGSPNIEAIIAAQKTNSLICCDDLFLRKYMNYIDITSLTVIDILIYLDYPFEYIIDNVVKLLERNYVSPITRSLILWISKCFQDSQDDETLEQYTLLTIDLVNEIIDIDEQRECLFLACKQIHEDKIALHSTLDWLITATLIKYFQSVSNLEGTGLVANN